MQASPFAVALPESKPPPPQRQQDQGGAAAGPGAGAIVPLRRPRGRPMGSKNKPKTPVIITRDNPNALHSHILEVPPAPMWPPALPSTRADAAVASACLARRAPSRTSPCAARPLLGRFELLSMTGTVLPPPAPAEASGLAVLLSAGQGQILGGCIVGPLVAAGTVTLFAATFANAVYERLPLQDDVVDVKPDLSTANTDASVSQEVQAQLQLPPMSQPMAMGAGYPDHRSPPYPWGGHSGGI